MAGIRPRSSYLRFNSIFIISKRRRLSRKKIRHLGFAIAIAATILEDAGVAILSSTESTPNTSTAQPRYRYYEEAPERITLLVSELLSYIPTEYRSHNGMESERSLELPCRELFNGNTPRLKLGLLHDLLPDLVRVPEGADREQRLPLPAGWLSLHYQLITRREELPPESEAAPEVMPLPETKIEECIPASLVFLEEVKAVIIAEEIKDPAVTVVKSIEPEAVAVLEVEKIVPLIAELASVEKKRGFFSSLPIFRRHETPKEPPAQETVFLATRELAPAPSLFKPRKTVEVKTEESLETKEAQKAEVLEITKELAPSEEKLLTLERLWKLDPSDQLADPAALQALFMTEEKLTLERVMALAGQLPGLRACVLTHGDQVACASNAPAGIDLRVLSTQAMTMLSQIRDSSTQMGLGAVPAITLHAEQGILSFLYQGELCLLVLHADRGFIPGVRERLAEMLGHLTSAKPVPDGASSQASLLI